MKKICIFTFAGRPSSSINEKSIKKSCCLNEMAAGFFCILREGEHEAPRELQALLDCGNRFRQIVMDNMHVGKQGNAVFAEAMRLAKREGIQPMLYTHPVGTFGYGAGPIIGLYTNQGFVPGTGERTIEEDTCFALELNVYDNRL